VRGTSGELSIALQVGVVGFRRRGSGLASDRAGAFERRRRRRYQAAGGWRLAANTSERVVAAVGLGFLGVGMGF
jgi:hypothetical protein